MYVCMCSANTALDSADTHCNDGLKEDTISDELALVWLLQPHVVRRRCVCSEHPSLTCEILCTLHKPVIIHLHNRTTDHFTNTLHGVIMHMVGVSAHNLSYMDPDLAHSCGL